MPLVKIAASETESQGGGIHGRQRVCYEPIPSIYCAQIHLALPEKQQDVDCGPDNRRQIYLPETHHPQDCGPSGGGGRTRTHLGLLPWCRI